MTHTAHPIDPEQLASRLARLGHSDQEAAAIAYLDAKWTILGLRHTAGRQAHLLLPVRGVIRDSLDLDAVQVVLAHGHPSGDTRPSQDDLAYTRVLARTLGAIGVTLYDHLIFAKGAMTSFRAQGRL